MLDFDGNSAKYLTMIRIWAALWFVGIIALTAVGFPPAAQAHMDHKGYGHGIHLFHAHVHHAHVHHARIDNARASANGADHQSVMVSGPFVEASSSNAPSIDTPGSTNPVSGLDYNDCCCCMIGHCATCVAVIVSDAMEVWFPASGADFGSHRSAPMADALPLSLKRPPRS